MAVRVDEPRRTQPLVGDIFFQLGLFVGRTTCRVNYGALPVAGGHDAGIDFVGIKNKMM